jgi:hypothetical protein
MGRRYWQNNEPPRRPRSPYYPRRSRTEVAS